MPTKDEWLKVVIEQIQDDLAEIRIDMKTLLEERAESRGKRIVTHSLVSAVVVFAYHLATIWFRV